MIPVALNEAVVSSLPQLDEYLADLHLGSFVLLLRWNPVTIQKGKKNKCKHCGWTEEALSSLQINVRLSPLVKDTKPFLFSYLWDISISGLCLPVCVARDTDRPKVYPHYPVLGLTFRFRAGKRSQYLHAHQNTGEKWMKEAEAFA